MRKIIFLFIILLTSAIWSSCRSSKQATVEHTDTVSVVAVESVCRVASDDILSIINAAREMDLSGITIEFWAPDSAHPDARAAPKSVHIDNAKTKESAQQSTHQLTVAALQGSRKLCAQRGSRSHEQSKTVTNKLSPPDWIIIVAITAVVIIFIITLSRKLRK